MTSETMRYYDGIDRLPPVSIEKIQDELLTEMVCYAGRMSPYYKKVFAKRGVQADEIEGIQYLGKLPLTSRDDLQEDNWSFLAVSREDIAEVVATTGTSGRPSFIALTAKDLERLACNEDRSFRYAEAGKGDLFHIAVTCDNLFIAGIAYYMGLMRRGAAVVRIGPQSVIRHLDIVDHLRPNGIVAVSSFMVQLLRRAEERGLAVRDLGIEKIVLIGDSIRNPNSAQTPWAALSSLPLEGPATQHMALRKRNCLSANASCTAGSTATRNSCWWRS